MKETIITMIKEQAYKNVDVELFAGADIIVSNSLTPEINRWLDGKELTEASSPNATGKSVVITKHARELSWLIYELKKLYSDEIDYLNKYEFYGNIARIANEYLMNNCDNEVESLLMYIVERI